MDDGDVRTSREPLTGPTSGPRGGGFQRGAGTWATMGLGRPAAGEGEPCPVHAGSAGGAQMGDADDVRDWLEARCDHLLAELIGWIRIRSVLGPPEREVDLRRSAQWLAGTLREVGFPTVEVWPTAGAAAGFAGGAAAGPGAPARPLFNPHRGPAAPDRT